LAPSSLWSLLTKLLLIPCETESLHELSDEVDLVGLSFVA